eukprot:Selendium_serpulae@DN6411_c0_g2_i1.p1
MNFNSPFSFLDGGPRALQSRASSCRDQRVSSTRWNLGIAFRDQEFHPHVGLLFFGTDGLVTVGVAINNPGAAFSLEFWVGGDAVGDAKVVPLTSTSVALGQVELHVEASGQKFIAGVPVDGAIVLKDDGGILLDCVYWGAGATNSPCTYNLATMVVGNMWHMENLDTLKYAGEVIADFQAVDAVVMDLADDTKCLANAAHGLGTALFGGSNEAQAFVNEVLVAAVCGSDAATSGFEIAYNMAGSVTLIVNGGGTFTGFADLTLSPGSDWKFEFITLDLIKNDLGTDASLIDFSNGYAVLVMTDNS